MNAPRRLTPRDQHKVEETARLTAEHLRQEPAAPPEPLTLDQVARMTTDEINANWEAVQDALKTNRRSGDAA